MMAEPEAVVSDAERRPLLARTSTADESDVANSARENTAFISVTRGAVLALSIFVLIFTLTCNVSAITTIQSPIAIEFNASSEVSWFNSAYLIAITSITPLSGKLSQIFSPRIYLIASVVIQVIGLLIVSQARSLAVFLSGRVVCGIGGSAVTPIAFILVTELTSEDKRGVSFGLINTGYTTGLACGAIIAGALEPALGWRAVFWLQIPLTTLAAATAFFAIPKREAAGSGHDELTMSQKLARIDYFGVLTLVIALVLLLYTLSAPKVEAAPLALSFAMLVLFVLVETKWASEPIVPPTILGSRANMFSGIATIGVMTARWGVLFYTPVFAIAVRGWSPIAAGSLLIPTNAGFASGGLVVGWLHIRRAGSFYIPTLVCFALFALVQFALAQVTNATAPIQAYIAFLFFNGFVVGGLVVYSLAHLLHLNLPSQYVIVIPFNATFRSFSGSFGSAITGGYFLRKLHSNLDMGFKDAGVPHREKLVSSLLGSPRLVQQLEGVKKEVAVWAYTSALQSTFLAGIGLALLMLVIQAFAGWTAPVAEEEAKARQDSNGGIARVVSHEAETTWGRDL